MINLKLYRNYIHGVWKHFHNVTESFRLTRACVSVCWSSPRHCDHFLSRVNAAGLPLGQVGDTAMFYCNTCGKSHTSNTRHCLLSTSQTRLDIYFCEHIQTFSFMIFILLWHP